MKKLGMVGMVALAATVLIHVVAALPPALLGLAATLVLHVRIADIEMPTDYASGTIRGKNESNARSHPSAPNG